MFLTSFTISVLRGCDWTAAESDGNKQNWNHIAVKKKTKKQQRLHRQLHRDLSSPPVMFWPGWSLRRDHRQPRLEILTGSPCFKPDTDCNIHFIPEYKRTISPWNPQTYCASPEQAAVRHDGEWNTKNTNKSRIRGDSEEKKSYLLMR